MLIFKFLELLMKNINKASDDDKFSHHAFKKKGLSNGNGLPTSSHPYVCWETPDFIREDMLLVSSLLCVCLLCI